MGDLIMRRQIYLVPGFFGFSQLGGFNYFQGVGKILREVLAQYNFDVEIIQCRTKPTASIRHRANRLVDEVCENGGLDSDEIYFVGHSTGGLDARLLCTPKVRLRPDTTVERSIVDNTRAVVTVATPHHGTPLASFFMTILGRQLLELLTALATSQGGRLGLLAAAQLVGFSQSARDRLGRDRTRLLDIVSKEVVSLTTEERDADALWQYLREIASDQGAMVQLMPETMHLFNAAVTDHPDVRYSSLVTVAPPPPSGYRVSDLFSPIRAALSGVFSLLYNITAREHRHYPYPRPDEDFLEKEENALSFQLDSRSNDGIVPTLSQIHGRMIDIVKADHLDIVGQFTRDDVPHGDWLPSGSHFDLERLEASWGGIAQEIVTASGK
jgi:hypothetical protein